MIFIGTNTNQNHQSAIFNINSYGVVAKWQGKGLQNPDHGFKSRRRLSELLKWAAFCFPGLADGRWEDEADSGKREGAMIHPGKTITWLRDRCEKSTFSERL